MPACVSFCQQNHVQGHRGRCQRCHPLPVFGGGTRFARFVILRRQPGRLGGEEAGVGALREARLRGEPAGAAHMQKAPCF